MNNWFWDFGVSELRSDVQALTRVVDQLKQGITKMRAELQQAIDNLSTQVSKNTSVTQGAADMIRGLAQQIRDAADDPAEVKALADKISDSADALAAAVAENTPAAEEPAQTE